MKESIINKIISETELYHNLSKFKIYIKTRKREIIIARHQAIFLINYYSIKLKSPITLQIIADKFNQTHANMLHAIKTVRNEIETNKNYKLRLDILIRSLDYKLPFLLDNKFNNINSKKICNTQVFRIVKVTSKNNKVYYN